MDFLYRAPGPIMEAQARLRELAKHDAALLPLIADGVFSRQTLEAVRAYQRARGLPVTGQLDLATWNRLMHGEQLPIGSLEGV
nr:peptidoglycan-binding domain-containing protein [bacterium]